MFGGLVDQSWFQGGSLPGWDLGWLLFSRICLVGDLFMELYHGIHHHFSPPFERFLVWNLFQASWPSKSKFKSWEFEATPFPKDTSRTKIQGRKNPPHLFP